MVSSARLGKTDTKRLILQRNYLANDRYFWYEKARDLFSVSQSQCEFLAGYEPCICEQRFKDTPFFLENGLGGFVAIASLNLC